MPLWNDKENFCSILPNNSTFLEREVEKLCAVNIFDFDPKFQNLKTPSKMPASLYLQLANEMQVDFWDESLNDEKKQEIILNAFNIHRIKGTKDSIIRALEVAGFRGFKIIERVLVAIYDGTKYHDAVHYYGGNMDKTAILYNGKIQYLGASFYSTPTKWAFYSIEFDGSQLLSAKQSIQVKQVLNAVAPARCKLLNIASNIKYNGVIKYNSVHSYGHYR